MEVINYTSSYNKRVNRDSHDHFLTVVLENLTKIANEIVEICHFVELNVTAIRKILKKADKQLSETSM
jgi:SPX domain protein involved in polyphosphate accumulation